MTNARIVVGFALALAVQVFHVGDVSADDSKALPNILIMVTDDQRWDQFGLVQAEQGDKGRFPFIKTPRLDALASQGMRFRNAFVTTSLCSPSRAAMLTGQYNHTNGIINNSTPFLPQPTWATALHARGYTTAMIGKWHHGEQLERPGFDYVASFKGQGNYKDTSFNVNGRKVRTKGYIDEQSVDFAIRFLEDQGNKPFAMMVGFKAVHEPFTPLPEHAGNYAADTILPFPNWDAIPPWNMPAVQMRRRAPINQGYWKQILRTVDGVDQNVGRLLDALDRLKLADNTLVIFTSDNGYYMGEHRLGDKRSAYEESLRVPLIVRLPGVVAAGSVSDAMVLNIDLAPTILDLAEQEIPTAMQGMSMRTLLGGESAIPWRRAFLYEYWREYSWRRGSQVPRTPTILAVRTATHKLITYPGNEKWTELFDLRTDPYELHNLRGYTSAKEIQSEMCTLLQQMLAETRYIARPSFDKWSLDLVAPQSGAQAQASGPLPTRPPLIQPHC